MNGTMREKDRQLQHKAEPKCSSDPRMEHYPHCALFSNIYFNFLLITTAHYLYYKKKKSIVSRSLPFSPGYNIIKYRLGRNKNSVQD